MKRKFWKIALPLISAVAVISIFAWAAPKRTEIADGYELIHFRGNGGMTYVVNDGGIKLAGPVIAELRITDDRISGLAGTDGKTPFSIDRQTGEVTHYESKAP